MTCVSLPKVLSVSCIGLRHASRLLPIKVIYAWIDSLTTRALRNTSPPPSVHEAHTLSKSESCESLYPKTLPYARSESSGSIWSLRIVACLPWRTWSKSFGAAPPSLCGQSPYYAMPPPLENHKSSYAPPPSNFAATSYSCSPGL